MEAIAMTSIDPPFRMTICGIDELAGHGEMGASHVLSILDPEHPVPEAFGSYGEHAKLELRFDDIIEPAPDKREPSGEDVAQILAFGRDLMREPSASSYLLVHCHAGISRSTAAMTLILAQAMPEQPAEAILMLVHSIREKAWPNLRIIEIGDQLLQRHGTLIAATHALHALQLQRRPLLESAMTEHGRGREIERAYASLARAKPFGSTALPS